jgi:hypothetical protein
VTVYVNVVDGFPLDGDTLGVDNVGALFVTVGPEYVDVVLVRNPSLA